MIKHLLSGQFMYYLVIGGLVTLIDWGLFFILNGIMTFHYMLALVVSFSVASALHYLLNKTITFRNRSKKIVKQFSVFVTVSVSSLVVTSLIMYLLVDLLALYPMASRIFTTFLMTILNFLAHKIFTFNRRFF